MLRGRNLVAIGLLTGALILPGTRGVQAQESPPNLRMLLNLDLFKPPPKDAPGAQGKGSNDSMLDQIRALNAMGYLGTAQSDSGQPLGRNTGATVAPSSPPSSSESSDSPEGRQ
jgi:hypothetical protein